MNEFNVSMNNDNSCSHAATECDLMANAIQKDELSLVGLSVEGLEISDFLDDVLSADGDVVSKVMAASCTTCECCCSCSG